MTNPSTSPTPSNGTPDEEAPEPEAVEVDLKPKSLPKLAPEGIRTFTVCRRSDETGISGEGIVIEGVTLAHGTVYCALALSHPPWWYRYL